MLITGLLGTGACSGSSKPSAPDGAAQDADTGTADAADAQDAGLQDAGVDGGPADQDIGDGFALVIPAGTSTCAMYFSPDVFLEYSLLGRVQLREGMILLPRDQAQFERDWIDLVELGPERTQPVPAGPGLFTREIQGDEQNGAYQFTYNRVYQYGGEPFTIEATSTFQVVDGQPEEPRLTLTQEILSPDGWDPKFWMTGVLGDGSDWASQGRVYMTCSGDEFMEFLHLADMQNGDRLEMTVRGGINSMPCGAYGMVLQASYIRGPAERQVSDYFDLALAAGCHGASPHYLIHFSEPLDGIHFLYLYQESGYPTELHYLDAGLNVTETVPITSYEVQQ